MIRAYVAGPYTGDEEANAIRAIRQGDRLDALGFNSFVPHLFHWWDRVCPGSYERWMEKCREELKRSDVMLRMDGASDGATREEQWAEEFGIPWFKTEEELQAWANQ